MYGLVHKSMRDYIKSSNGDKAWSDIESKLSLDESSFLALHAYDDAIIYGMVGAACEKLGKPADELLKAFGEYWITVTAKKSYGPLLNSYGASTFELCANLDAMHKHFASTFVGYRPPGFKTRSLTENSISLEYSSDRNGLVPFVEGLLSGMGILFEESLEITCIHVDESDGCVAKFVITKTH